MRDLPTADHTSVGQVPMDRLRSVFDGMFDGVWLVGPEGLTTYANGSMAGLLGTTATAMHGRPLQDFVDAERMSQMGGFLERERKQAGERMEFVLRRRDGTDLICVMAGSPIFGSDGAFVGTMLNVSDVTGKHGIDAQVIQGQRLEAIGQFASGIAHDFNNLLTSIQGYAAFVRERVPAGDPIGEDIDQVIAASAMAAAMTSKLLGFTRHKELQAVAMDPAEVVRNLQPILTPLLGDDVTLALDVVPGHSWITADPAQLEQVVVNLAINARDAMPAGGRVTISIHDLPAAAAERPDPDLTGGPFVRISVSDTGTGMDAATRDRIFDPFFTTKAPGKGTGLGLATVFGIVAQTGGQIQVETALGKGTTFHLNFPLAAPQGARDPEAATPEPAGAPVPSSHAGTILLVDDDPAVREFARRCLVAVGYEVFAADGSEQALVASAQWQGSIEVLVTDLAMPGLPGVTLAAEICARRPAIGVVFMSGSLESGLVGHGTLPVVATILPKPFTTQMLVEAVDRARAARRSDLSPAGRWRPGIAGLEDRVSAVDGEAVPGHDTTTPEPRS